MIYCSIQLLLWYEVIAPLLFKTDYFIGESDARQLNRTAISLALSKRRQRAVIITDFFKQIPCLELKRPDLKKGDALLQFHQKFTRLTLLWKADWPSTLESFTQQITLHYCYRLVLLTQTARETSAYEYMQW